MKGAGGGVVEKRRGGKKIYRVRDNYNRGKYILVQEGYGRRSTHELHRSCKSNCIPSKELAIYRK